MRSSPPIALLALAAALALPAGASAQTAVVDQPPGGGGDASVPVRQAVPWVDAPSLSRTPIASRESVTKNPPLAMIDAARAALTATATVPDPPAAALPRTGADTWLTLLTGAGLLLTGTGLRLRIAAPRR